MYPEAKSTVKYIKNGWHVTLAYIVSFFVMLQVVGWHPHAPHNKGMEKVKTEIPAIYPEGETNYAYFELRAILCILR